MPVTVTSSLGNVYHLFQLQEPSYWEPEESIRFEELENELGDGYYSQALYGSNTGLRRWKLKLNTLATAAVLPLMVTSVTGASVSREKYLRDLFNYTKVTGRPFVFTSPITGQYYFARFADKELTYQKMRIQLYSTGVELKQVRLPGETVFNIYIDRDPIAANGYIGTPFDPDFWLRGTSTDEGGNGNGFNDNGDVIETTVGGVPVARFNSVAPGTGYWDAQDNDAHEYYDIFLLLKVRSGTFDASRYQVLTNNAVGVGAVLSGEDATTKFTDLSLPDGYEYRLDGTLYDESDQQAPMNTWGIVHLRFTDGMSFENMMFGVDDSTTANMDISEVLAFDELQPDSDVNEIMEYLTVIRNQLNG